MRLSDFSTVLFRSAQLAGLDRGTINQQTFAMLRDFSNSRLAWVWEHDLWQELIRVAELTVVTGGDTVKTVTLSADVGDLFSIYNTNPRLGTLARQVQYFLYDSGAARLANITDPTSPATVWAEYRIVKPEIYGDPYSATVVYSIGSQVYWDTSSNSGSFIPGAGKLPAGNFYNCIVATTAGQSPQTTPGSWSLVEIPKSFAEYLARGVVSDYWRSEGDYERAAAAEGDASAAIDRLIDLQSRQQGQVQRLNVLGY